MGSGIRVYAAADSNPAGSQDRPLHLAVGMFDGVHRGHQAVLAQAREATRADGGLSGVLTFDPHPSRVLYPERATDLIMPLAQRIDRMLLLGMDRVLVQSFTREYARRKAEDFLPRLQDGFPTLQSVHIGVNFRFGQGRNGDVTLLRRSGEGLGIAVHALERQIDGSEPISSSRIRTALKAGRIGEANAMLGYPYAVSGSIRKGRQIGRGLGFPTVNIPWDPETKPCFGVYQVVSKTPEPNAPVRPGIANYGLRPTVGGREGPLLEVHYLDDGPFPAPGTELKVALLDFLRPEKPFPSVTALREQIAADVAAVKTALFPEIENF
jgi:riboflavin kinase/FMN adenylyltransferase